MTGTDRLRRQAMALWQFLLLFVFLALSSSSLLSDANTCSAPRSNNDNDYISQLQEIKRKIAHLELVLEESIQKLNEKIHYVEEQNKLIQQLSHKIQLLQSAVLNLKADSLHADQRLNALEEEVQRLWAASRKNNFDIHLLESKARDAEDTLETVTSQVEKMGDIVTEKWMHIQRLEQAVHITEARALKARREGYMRCSFFKLVNALSSNHLQKVHAILDLYIHPKGPAFSSYFSQAWHQLKRVFVVIKTYHHQLQRFIKQEMEKNEFTAALANSELVFFVVSFAETLWADITLIIIANSQASALITFPVIGGWMFLSSQFR